MAERITWRRVEDLHRAIEEVDPKKLIASGVSAIVVDGDEDTDEVLVDLSVAPESRRFSVTWSPLVVSTALQKFQMLYESYDEPLDADDVPIGRWLARDHLAVAIDALQPIVQAQAEEADRG